MGALRSPDITLSPWLANCYIYTQDSNQFAAIPSVLLSLHSCDDLVLSSTYNIALSRNQALKPPCCTSPTVKRRLSRQSFLGEDDLESIISIMDTALCSPQAQTVCLTIFYYYNTTCAICARLLLRSIRSLVENHC